MYEVESHPFEPFVPLNAKILIVGSFPGREQTQSNYNEKNKYLPTSDWYYGSKRNQFWDILRSVYQVELLDSDSQKKHFEQYGIAITDIFYKVRRIHNNNLDQNLEIIEYNTESIRKILQENNIIKILFTSKFVEKHFKKVFPEIRYTECLQSPSPRFAKMSK